MTNYLPATLPIPSYIMSSDSLANLHASLWPFKIGDPEVTDEPCERAAAACTAIEEEMIKRGRPITL